LLTLLLVAGSVGLDNFAAAVAIGLAGVDRRLRLRIAIVFGLFEAGMPVIGLLAGRGLARTLGSEAHLVGGGLLILVGVHAGVEAIRGGDDDEVAALPSASLRRLFVLAAALSIDNLVIGFALGAHHSPIVLAIVVIGVVSIGLSLVGLELGSRLGEGIEHLSEVLGAVVLVAVGLAILFRVV
jgi:putative Mn2+ efflux pump MntP